MQRMQEFWQLNVIPKKIVCAKRAVTSATVITIKEKQNPREAQHIEDADTFLKEVTCIQYAIKYVTRTTLEAVCTIND